jgi:hypothetical protein
LTLSVEYTDTHGRETQHMLMDAFLTRFCVQLKSAAMKKEIAESQSECAKNIKVSVRQILSVMTSVDAPLANCFSLASPARPETERQRNKETKPRRESTRDEQAGCCAAPFAPRYFLVSSQACQDLDKGFRERTKALEAEQVLADVPRALPP